MTHLFNTREDLLNVLPKNSKGIEVGVFKGEFADKILEIVNPSKLFLMDHWTGSATSSDKDGRNLEKITDLKDYYKTKIIPKYIDDIRVMLLRMRSDKISMLDNDSLDFCYLDADHRYPQVYKDLVALYPIIKNGGYIMGHDYTNTTKGVVQSVDRFCEEYNLNINFLTKDGKPSYAIIK